MQKGKPAKQIGVLLAQLGTPAAPTPRALRPYLKEFLSDPRVIDLPRLKWLPILYLAILPRRPARPEGPTNYPRAPEHSAPEQ